MNTEDRLSRAADEMDRVAASVNAPSVDQIRRPARMRSFGVAAAAAAAAIVLIGGSLLVLRPGGEATPGPAAPWETTTLSPEGLASLVVIGEPDHEPYFDLDGSLRRDLVPVSAEVLTADLEALAAHSDPKAPRFVEITEIVSLGQMAGLRAYVVNGVWQPEGYEESHQGECVVSIGEAVVVETCSEGRDLAGSYSLQPFTLGEAEGTLVFGPAPEGSSVAYVSSDSAAAWQQTVAGYWFIAVENTDQGPLELTVYSLSGDVRLGPLAISDWLNAYSGPHEVAGVPFRVPGLDEEPGWRPYETATEVPFEVPGNLERDLEDAVDFFERDSLDSDDELLVLGTQYGYRAFAIRGDVRAVGDDGEPSYEACAVILEPGSTVTVNCALSLEPATGFLDFAYGADGVYGLAGLAPAGANVAMIEVSGQSWWARTRGGYVFLTAEASTSAGATYRFFAADGSEIQSGEIPYVGSGPTTTSPTLSCSGSGMSPSALALSSVPQPVAQKLWEIGGAAEACDFASLAEHASDNFTASFGGDDPAELWAYEEEQGYEPMAWLMKVLDLPHGTREIDGKTLYVWPRAAAHDGDWDTMPQEYVDDLRAVYDEDDFEGFRQFGAYIGYRVGIYEDGDWSFFVIGD